MKTIRNTSILLAAAAMILTVACGRREGVHRWQDQQVEVIEEGSADGVTARIGPESGRVQHPPPLTETGVDTTTSLDLIDSNDESLDALGRAPIERESLAATLEQMRERQGGGTTTRETPARTVVPTPAPRTSTTTAPERRPEPAPSPTDTTSTHRPAPEEQQSTEESREETAPPPPPPSEPREEGEPEPPPPAEDEEESDPHPSGPRGANRR